MNYNHIISRIRKPSAQHLLNTNGDIAMYWWSDLPNVGDAISPIIVEGLAGRKTTTLKHDDHPKLLAVGSLIQRRIVRAGDVIWGSGVLRPEVKLKTKRLKVTAVRGPLTRDILLAQGIECPEIYGDPGILLPNYLDVGVVEKTYKLGIIPHHTELEILNISDPSIQVISVEESPTNFIRKLLSCERIVSSSLHGIILAEAYGIPADWMKLTDKLAGGEFKFNDYYEGTGRTAHTPLSEQTIFNERDITKPTFNLGALIDAFPTDLINE